jgi:hypothetical protein
MNLKDKTEVREELLEAKGDVSQLVPDTPATRQGG